MKISPIRRYAPRNRLRIDEQVAAKDFAAYVRKSGASNEAIERAIRATAQKMNVQESLLRSLVRLAK